MRTSNGCRVSIEVNEVREYQKSVAQLHQYGLVSYGTSCFACTMMQPEIELPFPDKVMNKSTSLLLLIYLHVRFREGNHLWKSFRDMQVLHLIP